MDPRIVAGLIKRVYNKFDMDSFSNRLKLQKYIYLLQTFGIDVGYSFSWYIYGPYSTQLTRTGFEAQEHFPNVEPLKLKNQQQEKVFIQFQEFIENHKEDDGWLEITSSIHFLKAINPDKTKDQIIEEIQNKQDYFKDQKENINRIWKELEEAKII